MRSILRSGLLVIGMGVGGATALAQNNFLDNAQRFLNSGQDNRETNRDAYERGRQDEARAERERRRDAGLHPRYPDRYDDRYSDRNERGY